MRPLTGLAPLIFVLLLALPAPARSAEPALGEGQSPPTAVDRIRAQAEALRPLMQTPLAGRFLDAARALPRIEDRVFFHDPETDAWLTPAQASAVPEPDRLRLVARTLGEQFYYETRYGSPLVYARVIDLAASVNRTPLDQFEQRRILDFGYGTAGHLRMIASLNGTAVGVDIDPLLAALYSRREDKGLILPALVPLKPDWGGWLSLYHGRYPQDGLFPGCRDGRPGRLTLRCGFHVITSKNTLKRGYVNPTRPVEDRFRVHLGVSDEEFVRAVFDNLYEGGLFIIYNLSERESLPGEPYKPAADGRCPFPRGMLEEAGFEVVAFDASDDRTARQIFTALGYPTLDGEGRDNLFAYYTIARRPSPG